MKGLLYRLVDGKYHQYLEKQSIKLWKEFVHTLKKEKRQQAYTKNYMYRRRLRLLFKSWKNTTNEWGKERINSEALNYEASQRQIHLEGWNQKVDALKLYMAQL